jgi:predicted amidohydrolase
MRQAAAAGARLLHCPEAALSGYAKAQIAHWDAVDWGTVQAELEALARLAARLGIWVVLGCNHRLGPPQHPSNSLYVISDRGEVAARYDKRICSHTELSGWYTPGTDPLVFEVDGIRFGCALCIEVCFPEIFAEYERLGVHCVLLSAYSEDPIHGVMARAHAATNSYWLSLATPAACSAWLPSAQIGPDGHGIGACAPGEPGLTLCTIDPAAPEFEVALRRARPWRAEARGRRPPEDGALPVPGGAR